MGFNTWNKFHCDIDESMVKEVANAMVDTGMCLCLSFHSINRDDVQDESLGSLLRLCFFVTMTIGLKDAGYTYVNIDDCWMKKERDPVSGRQVVDDKRFPSGMKVCAGRGRQREARWHINLMYYRL